MLCLYTFIFFWKAEKGEEIKTDLLALVHSSNDNNHMLSKLKPGAKNRICWQVNRDSNIWTPNCHLPKYTSASTSDNGIQEAQVTFVTTVTKGSPQSFWRPLIFVQIKTLNYTFQQSVYVYMFVCWEGRIFLYMISN